jgi:hypothetical protein
MEGKSLQSLGHHNISRSPHAMPNKYHKWFPRFQGNNVVLAQTHVRDFENILIEKEVEHEDVVMELFVLSLEEDARVWLRNLNDASIKTWDAFKALFLEQWEVKKMAWLNPISRSLMKVKKKENEIVREFNMKFQKLIDKILEDIRPKGGVVLLYYVNAFEGNLGFFKG